MAFKDTVSGNKAIDVDILFQYRNENVVVEKYLLSCIDNICTEHNCRLILE